MQIDFSQVLTDLSGKPIKNGDADPATDLTLGVCVANSLMAPRPNSPLAGAEAVRRMKFAERALAGSVERSGDWTPEEVVLMRDCIVTAGYPPIVVARAWAMLDPPPA